MAEEEKKKPGRPPGRKKTASLQMRIDPRLLDALEKLAEENKRSRTKEAEVALEAHLRAQGRWPPPGNDDEKGGA